MKLTTTTEYELENTAISQLQRTVNARMEAAVRDALLFACAELRPDLDPIKWVNELEEKGRARLKFEEKP